MRRGAVVDMVAGPFGGRRGRVPRADLRPFRDRTITNNHWDADGFLPVWALLHPQEALARWDLLVDTARNGDFGVVEDERAAALNLALEGLYWRVRRRVGAGGADRVRRAEAATYAAAVEHFGRLVADPHAYRDLWVEAWARVRADVAYLRRPGRVIEAPEAHASVVLHDRPRLSGMAVGHVAKGDLLVLWRTDRPLRTVRVRGAIAGYELTSVPDQPRYDLTLLAQRLNAAERAAGGRPAPGGAGGDVWEQPNRITVRTAWGSALTCEAVLRLIGGLLAQPGRAADECGLGRVPAGYRALAREVQPRLEHHLIYHSPSRLEGAPEVRFAPGRPFAGLHLLARADGERLALAEAGGRPALAAAGARGPRALPFKVLDRFYSHRDRGRAPAAGPLPLELELDFVDRGRGRLLVEYDGAAGEVTPLPPVEVRGTGAWRTARFRIDDGRFLGSQEGGADLRLRREGGAELLVGEVRLRRVGGPRGDAGG
jgi:hypothetical protein